MKINVALTDGYLPDAYGKYAPAPNTKDGHPCVSFPIEITEVPGWAKTLAITLVDWDSIPACGFAWIHWCACNIPIVNEIPENASRSGELAMVQGLNSSWSPLFADPATKAEAAHYTGPYPPDKDHTYTLRVFALDCELDLPEGYCLNEFRHAVKGHVIDSARLELLSRA